MQDINFIFRCFRWVTNNISSEYLKDELSEELTTKMNRFYDVVGKKIDWYSLTREDCITLGFMCYEKDSTEDTELWLIPQWMYPIIPQGMSLFDLDRKEFTFTSTENCLELFYGCLPYGICLSVRSE